MDENQTNTPVLMSGTESASIGPRPSQAAPLADTPQQQAAADARVAASADQPQRDAFGLPPVKVADEPDLPRNPGETDEAYADRVKASEAATTFAADLAAKQDAAAKAGTTAHPSGLPAQAAFGQRMQDAMFRLRNHGYDEVTSLLDDLYAGVQRIEATARGVPVAIPAGSAQQPGESDADYAARTSG